ncbi:hypothetical protein [Buchananella felis]
MLVLSNRDLPAALSDLSGWNPFVLWAHGAALFLARLFTKLMTIIGS